MNRDLHMPRVNFIAFMILIASVAVAIAVASIALTISTSTAARSSGGSACAGAALRTTRAACRFALDAKAPTASSWLSPSTSPLSGSST